MPICPLYNFSYYYKRLRNLFLLQFFEVESYNYTIYMHKLYHTSIFIETEMKSK